jgi:hypothetical protein
MFLGWRQFFENHATKLCEARWKALVGRIKMTHPSPVFDARH